MNKFIYAIAALTFCMGSIDANVVNVKRDGTYQVDPSGSVDRPRPKCDLKNHNKPPKKSLKKNGK